MSPRRLSAERALLAGAGSLLLLFVALPLLTLVATSSPQALFEGLAHPLAGPALQLSLLTTATSLAVVLLLGTPLAWTLAQARGRWVGAVEVLLQLPMVIPPAVVGVALLLAFGRLGALAALYPSGWSPAFSGLGVVLAQIFVSAPLFVLAALSAFRALDPELLAAARTLGAGPLSLFLRLGLPLAGRTLAVGAAMSWARALGEFGATLMFAGNLRGRTQTLPLAIYSALETDLEVARSLSVVLVAVAVALLVFLRLLTRGAHGGGVAQ